MTTFKRSIVFLTLILIALGCGTNEDVLEEAGVLGLHEFNIRSNFTNTEGFIEGTLSGGLIFGVNGEISGSVYGQRYIEFSWSPFVGEALTSSFPSTLFHTYIDDTQQKPVLRFVFEEDWLDSPADNTQEIISVNKLILESELSHIEVFISKSDLEKHKILPQPSTASKIRPDLRNLEVVEITYHMQFYTIYTGVETYPVQIGKKVFRVSKEKVACSGLPIIEYSPPSSTVIDFLTPYGDRYELLIPTTSDYVQENSKLKCVPGAKTVAVRKAKGYKNKPNYIYLKARVEKVDEGTFFAYISTNEDKVKELMNKYADVY